MMSAPGAPSVSEREGRPVVVQLWMARTWWRSRSSSEGWRSTCTAANTQGRLVRGVSNRTVPCRVNRLWARSVSESITFFRRFLPNFIARGALPRYSRLSEACYYGFPFATICFVGEIAFQSYSATHFAAWLTARAITIYILPLKSLHCRIGVFIRLGGAVGHTFQKRGEISVA